MKKTTLLHFLVCFSFLLQTYATDVEFFATKSSSSDINMLTMTTDLFYKQLQGLGTYSVIDKRNIPFSNDIPTNGIAFYAQIEEGSNGSWLCTLNARKNGGQFVSETRTYASYYKILLDAKASIESIMATLATAPQNGAVGASKESNAFALAGLDALAGTWTGEEQIDKIIILRGGKGFVIFKNGASMNITVSVSGNTVSIEQNGRANASFFPDLPRDVALKNATNANPITWNLTIVDASTMKGTKTTLIADASSETGTSTGSLSVEWVKK